MIKKKMAKKKLCGQTGETLAETLVALLISAVALVMLASMITSSSHMISTARTQLNNYYANAESLNTKTTATGSGKMVFSDESDSEIISMENTDITYYSNTAFSNVPVVAYKLNATSTTPAGGGEGG